MKYGKNNKGFRWELCLPNGQIIEATCEDIENFCRDNFENPKSAMSSMKSSRRPEGKGEYGYFLGQPVECRYVPLELEFNLSAKLQSKIKS